MGKGYITRLEPLDESLGGEGTDHEYFVSYSPIPENPLFLDIEVGKVTNEGIVSSLGFSGRRRGDSDKKLIFKRDNGGFGEPYQYFEDRILFDLSKNGNFVISGPRDIFQKQGYRKLETTMKRFAQAFCIPFMQNPILQGEYGLKDFGVLIPYMDDIVSRRTDMEGYNRVIDPSYNATKKVISLR